MHPILIHRRRMAAYLAAWLIPSAGLGALLHLVAGLSWDQGLILAVPAGIAYAFLCLASWYPARSLPLGRISTARVFFIHLTGALISTAVWLVAVALWGEILDHVRQSAGIISGFRREAPILAGFGVLLYLLTAALHHLLALFEASRAAERRALELNILAREAELKALRAQVDPHFLFNSLNSISALTQTDPPAARSMCILLGDFLRLSMRLGQKERIHLRDELALVRGFLGIEKVRYGSRLRLEETIAEDALDCLVPPLILQPLVENAVRHGIAHLVEGGVVLLTAERTGRTVRLSVENERDPEARTQAGEGMGLGNARRRIEGSFGSSATFEARADGNWFRVRLLFPAETGMTAVPADANPEVANPSATRGGQR